ncbi:hypothetical protein NEOLI_002498 [Neolecta irregularis DAH-3]|uniref:Uncharacterized protein n=1 Tax=Neolecta irregularis (strain DAH-3) TaxID=1198029 RepID=A0A1U7LUM5_NEOID|nr:hypothetical protein NEOLI_002498 [Neolecta irregularis DAH-3]|eukprot:OLL26367.1 hypothetical protein NEOLI_002498 [Neolecta irregularis DAH-3]
MNIPLPSTKKRKRPNGKESLVPSSFFNLPPDPNSFDTPLSITPFGTASRIFIPVYWVSGSLQLFHAPLAIRPGTVILAKLDGEKTLVCIEWIGDQIFALCKLSEHVRVKELRNVIKVSSKHPVPVDDGAIISAIRDDHGEELWKQIKAPFTKRPIVGLEKFMVEKDLHERYMRFCSCKGR